MNCLRGRAGAARWRSLNHPHAYAGGRGAARRGAGTRQPVAAGNPETFARLLCLPLFLYLLFDRDNPAGAAWLLGALGATDWVDGYLARRLGQVSEFGKVFDPAVDRILFIVATIAIIIADAAPVWFCWAVVAREVFVGGMMLIATLVFHMERFDVELVGEAGDVPADVRHPRIVRLKQLPGAPSFQVAAWCVGIPGLALSWITAVAYVPQVHIAAGRRATAVGRCGRSRPVPSFDTVGPHERARGVALLVSTTSGSVEANGRVRIGITDYAQDSLGDVVFVQLPTLGDTVASGARWRGREHQVGLGHLRPRRRHGRGDQQHPQPVGRC